MQLLGRGAAAPFGFGEEAVGVGRGNAGEGRREHADQVAVVIGMGERPERVDGEADDLGRREVRRRADLVRDAGGAQRLFELASVAADAAQDDGDVAGAVARAPAPSPPMSAAIWRTTAVASSVAFCSRSRCTTGTSGSPRTASSPAALSP